MPGNGQTLQSGSSSEALVGGRLQPTLPGVTHPPSPRPGLASGSFPEAPAAVATPSVPLCSYAVQTPASRAHADDLPSRRGQRPHRARESLPRVTQPLGTRDSTFVSLETNGEK